MKSGRRLQLISHPALLVHCMIIHGHDQALVPSVLVSVCTEAGEIDDYLS